MKDLMTRLFRLSDNELDTGCSQLLDTSKRCGQKLVEGQRYCLEHLCHLTRRNVHHTVLRILSEYLAVPVEEIDLNVSLEDMGADSLDLLELVLMARETFGIEVSDKVVQELKTPGEFIHFLTQALLNSEKYILNENINLSETKLRLTQNERNCRAILSQIASSEVFQNYLATLHISKKTFEKVFQTAVGST